MRANAVFIALVVATTPTWATDCAVPSSPAGITFINVIDERYSPDNPNAGGIVKLLPATDGSYELRVLNKGVTYSGRYTYARLTDQVAQLHMIENFPGQPTDYNLTLVCLDNSTGTLVYTQNTGAIRPERRQNTGRYTITD